MVVLHSLVSLLFIWDDSRRNTFTKLAFFINTIFVLVILSFLASLFGIWKLVSGETVGHFYQTFFVVAFAALHADVLSKALKKENYIDYVVYANYGFIIIVALMLQPIIYVANAQIVLGQMYFRFLAAAGIIDGTLSILTIIFYKLYMHKHPEIDDIFQNKTGSNDAPARRGLSIWVWILIIYLAFQILWPLFFLGLRGIFYHGF
jgi:hypothetical protein